MNYFPLFSVKSRQTESDAMCTGGLKNDKTLYSYLGGLNPGNGNGGIP